LIGCSQRPGKADQKLWDLHIKYAQGFKLEEHDGAKWVEVTQPYQGASRGYRYLLVRKGDPVPPHDDAVTVITVPLQSIVCTSTTHVPLLDYLGETHKLVGFPTTDYICSEKMRARIDSGKVRDLGVDKEMNLEQLLILKPSMVMGYSMGPDLGQLRKISRIGIPVVVNAEYLEKHPLGRAEWIKFMAVFFGKEKVADSVFKSIESEYERTRILAVTSIGRPTVMSGIVYGDVWFLPGGQNYAARLLEDAACNYLWNDNGSNGFLELSFESVFEKAHEADLWIGVASYTSLSEIRAADGRYANFKSFRNHAVFTYNARKGAKGGSDYLEQGYLRPDLVLKDLVKIAHPELESGYTLFFYGKLKD